VDEKMRERRRKEKEETRWKMMHERTMK